MKGSGPGKNTQVRKGQAGMVGWARCVPRAEDKGSLGGETEAREAQKTKTVRAARRD